MREEKSAARTPELRMAIARFISDGIAGKPEGQLDLHIDYAGDKHERCAETRWVKSSYRCLDARCDRCYPAAKEPEFCARCGHQVIPLTLACGWGRDAAGNALCHPNEPGHEDCYTIVTRSWHPAAS